MTDRAVLSVIFCQKLPKNYPKMRRDYPNTTLNYYQILLKIRIVSEKRRLPEHYPDMYKKGSASITPADPLFWIAKGVLYSFVFVIINDNSITSNITSNGSAITILENDVMTRKIPSTFFFHAQITRLIKLTVALDCV